jgi:hypothetical protein
MLTLFVVPRAEREIIGTVTLSGRFQLACSKNRKREAIILTVRHEAGRCSFRDSSPNPNHYARERRAYLRGKKSQATDWQSLEMMAEKD